MRSTNEFIHHISDFESHGYINVLHKDGIAHAQGSWWEKKSDGYVLSNLHVDEDRRGEGIATMLQEIREEHAKSLGYRYTYLFVKKGSWMRKWYARRGYVYHGPYEGDKKFIWLKKKL